MDDFGKTKEQLVTELAQLRQKIAELEVTETEYKRAREALLASETQYRRLFETAKDGVLILDAETGEITAVNPFLTDLLGYSPKEILGQKLWEIDSFQNMTASSAAFQELQSKEYIRSQDLSLKTQDGRPIAIEFVSTVYMVDLHKKVIQCNIRDITERQRAAEAARRAEQRYRALFEGAPVMYLITRNEGGTPVIADCNELFLSTLGYTRTELLERSLADLYAPDSRRELLTGGYQRALDGSFFAEERQLVARDGHIIKTLLRAMPETDTQGKVVGTRAMFVDITERKRAEEAVRENETRYRAVTYSANDAIITADSVGNIVDWNPAAERTFGYTQAEASGQSLSLLVPPQYQDRHLQGIQRMQAGGEPHIIGKTVELTGRHKGGDEFPLELSLAQWGIAGSRFYTGIIRDITERKQAEQALHESEASLRESQRVAHVGHWTWDTLKNQVIWSDEMKRIFGLDPAQFVGDLNEIIMQAIHPEDREKVINANSAVLTEQKPAPMEYRVVRPDQSVRTVWAVPGHKDTDENGNILKLTGIVQDITARKQLEAENEQLAAQFYQAQKMESIGRLAGGIAHDFNNLLVPIIGYTELAMLNLAPESQLHTDLKRIKGAGERAAELTRQILAFSRQQVLEMKSLDLNLVCSGFEPMLRRLIRENIDLQLHLAANLPPLNTDKGQLEQVLLNLVVNARDAMPDGGRLTIETAFVMLDEAYVAKHVETQPGPYVQMSVSDTGYGMDAATQQRIFEPFFTTKPVGQGTGLGLATVFGIVKQHGGNIWVYSEPDKGTTFKIYLPVTDAPVLTEEAANLDTGSWQGTETVLVVEDEAGVRQLVGEMLKAYGYHVLTAGDPIEGLELAAAREGHIDLLLTDVIMPHMNGRELYRQLASIRSGLKALYMSGYTDNAIVHHGVLDHGVAFLQKPFSISALLQKVRTVLG